MEYLSEILKIIEHVAKGNNSVALNYSQLLVDKLRENGDEKTATLIENKINQTQDISDGLIFPAKENVVKNKM